MSLSKAIRLLVEHSIIVDSSTTANWNSGVATSGLAGADLFTVGSINQWYRLNDGWFITTGFNAAATITIREYMIIAGAERLIMDDDLVIAGHTEDVYTLSWFWDTQMFGPFRVEVYSDQAIDDGLAVLWEYRRKGW